MSKNQISGDDFFQAFIDFVQSCWNCSKEVKQLQLNHEQNGEQAKGETQLLNETLKVARASMIKELKQPKSTVLEVKAETARAKVKQDLASAENEIQNLKQDLNKPVTIAPYSMEDDLEEGKTGAHEVIVSIDSTNTETEEGKLSEPVQLANMDNSSKDKDSQEPMANPVKANDQSSPISSLTTSRVQALLDKKNKLVSSPSLVSRNNSNNGVVIKTEIENEKQKSPQKNVNQTLIDGNKDKESQEPVANPVKANDPSSLNSSPTNNRFQALLKKKNELVTQSSPSLVSRNISNDGVVVRIEVKDYERPSSNKLKVLDKPNTVNGSNDLMEVIRQRRSAMGYDDSTEPDPLKKWNFNSPIFPQAPFEMSESERKKKEIEDFLAKSPEEQAAIQEQQEEQKTANLKRKQEEREARILKEYEERRKIEAAEDAKNQNRGQINYIVAQGQKLEKTDNQDFEQDFDEAED